jgi:hypothetical protein
MGDREPRGPGVALIIPPLSGRGQVRHSCFEAQGRAVRPSRLAWKATGSNPPQRRNVGVSGRDRPLAVSALLVALFSLERGKRPSPPCTQAVSHPQFAPTPASRKSAGDAGRRVARLECSLPPVGRVVQEVLGLTRMHRHDLHDVSSGDGCRHRRDKAPYRGGMSATGSLPCAASAWRGGQPALGVV